MKLTEYQKKFLADNNRRVVCAWGRATGKTMATAIRAISHAKLHKKSNVVILTPSPMFQRIVRDKVFQYLEWIPSLRSRITEWLRKHILRQQVKIGRYYVTLRNGSTIYIERPPTPLHGLKYKKLLIEEPDLFSDQKALDDFVYRNKFLNKFIDVIGTPLTFRASTPKGEVDFFWKIWNDAAFKRHHAKTSENPLIKQSVIRIRREMLDDETFRREYEAEFL